MRNKPAECETLEEVRAEIDSIDREVIALLGRRFGYVRTAARFKASPAAVAAPDRLRAMIEKRRLWAAEENLSPDAIEKLYRDLVEYFTREEMEHWSAGDDSDHT